MRGVLRRLLMHFRRRRHWKATRISQAEFVSDESATAMGSAVSRITDGISKFSSMKMKPSSRGGGNGIGSGTGGDRMSTRQTPTAAMYPMTGVTTGRHMATLDAASSPQLLGRAKAAEMIELLKKQISAEMGMCRFKHCFIVDLTG